VEVVPLTILLERNRLERTLRHELTHVVTRAPLAGRPLWVLEGLAEYVAAGDPRSAPTAAPARCPDDAAFVAASSGSELARLYDRAAACVAGRLADGRSWRTLP
jgi:hypothetical protein